MLAALPQAEWRRCEPHLECVELRLGQVLYESHIPQTHVLFPTSAIVSLLHTTLDGALAEFAVVGHEGVVGVPVFLGGRATPGRGVVTSAGRGFRIGAQAINDEFNRSGRLMHVLLRYTQP